MAIELSCFGGRLGECGSSRLELGKCDMSSQNLLYLSSWLANNSQAWVNDGKAVSFLGVLHIHPREPPSWPFKTRISWDTVAVLHGNLFEIESLIPQSILMLIFWGDILPCGFVAEYLQESILGTEHANWWKQKLRRLLHYNVEVDKLNIDFGGLLLPCSCWASNIPAFEVCGKGWFLLLFHKSFHVPLSTSFLLLGC